VNETIAVTQSTGNTQDDTLQACGAWWSELPHLKPSKNLPVISQAPRIPRSFNTNPSPEDRAAVELHRQACLEEYKQNRTRDANQRVDAIRAENAEVARARIDSGLGHLNYLDHDDHDDDLPSAKFTHKPSAVARTHILLRVGIQDVVVKSSVLNSSVKSKHSGGGKRGVIKELTRAAVGRMKLHFRNAPEEAHRAILTLTYPKDYTSSGKEVKRQLDLIKRWLKRHGVKSGSWFLEFQRRGAPHFHCYLNTYPMGGVGAVSLAWYNIVGSGDPKHLAWHQGKLSGRPCLEWFRVPHAASAYASKYATKQEQKEVPAEYQDVGRFWGCWGESRPVWRWLSGSGRYALATAHSAIAEFRSRFQDETALHWWSLRAYASCTMWGGSAEIDGLLSAHGWDSPDKQFCPF